MRRRSFSARETGGGRRLGGVRCRRRRHESFPFSLFSALVFPSSSTGRSSHKLVSWTSWGACLLSLLRSQDFDSLGPSSRSLHKLPSHQFNTLLLPTSSTLRWTHDAIVVSHSRPCVRRLSSLVLLACTKWTSRLASRSFDCFLSVCIHRASSSCDASSSELLPFSCYSRIRFPIFGLSERRSCSLPSPFAVA